MTLQITLIGLGRTGTSLGLALKNKKETDLKITGHDLVLAHAKEAERVGALDKAEWNLPASCEAADIIFLCVPFGALRAVLSQISGALKPETVIVDLALLKAPALTWASESLPANVSYVSVSPALNPTTLQGDAAPASATLFADGLWAMSASPEANPEAVKLVSSLAQLVGATPFFIGADEYDALSTSVNLLPALSAISLMLAASGGAGWVDARKIADRNFATVTTPLAMGAETLSALFTHNRANTLHELDALLAQLKILREAFVANNAEKIEALIQQAVTARDEWLTKRRAANWVTEEVKTPQLPQMGDIFSQLTGIGKKKLNDK